MATQQLFNADCMEELPKYPDKYFDLAIVDPPYGSGNTLEQGYNRFGGRFDKYKRIDRRGGQWAAKYGKKVIAWDVAPGPEYFKELLRVSKNAIIWGGQLLYPPALPVLYHLAQNKHTVARLYNVPRGVRLDELFSKPGSDRSQQPGNGSGATFPPDAKAC